jgi:hypothetical protein
VCRHTIVLGRRSLVSVVVVVVVVVAGSGICLEVVTKFQLRFVCLFCL